MVASLVINLTPVVAMCSIVIHVQAGSSSSSLNQSSVEPNTTCISCISGILEGFKQMFVYSPPETTAHKNSTPVLSVVEPYSQHRIAPRISTEQYYYSPALREAREAQLAAERQADLKAREAEQIRKSMLNRSMNLEPPETTSNRNFNSSRSPIRPYDKQKKKTAPRISTEQYYYSPVFREVREAERVMKLMPNRSMNLESERSAKIKQAMLERSLTDPAFRTGVERKPSITVLGTHENCSEDYRFDIIQLAIYWLPGFCRLPDSNCLPTNGPVFSIHGLWPTRNDELGPEYCCHKKTLEPSLD